MLVQVIIQRLRHGLETQSVFGAAEFYGADENTAYNETPTYFVVPQTENAPAYENDDAFILTQSIQIVVMHELKANDPRGEAAFYDVRADRNKLFRQLLGWVPDKLYLPTQYASGRLVEVRGARIFYAYNFTFSEQIDPECDGFQGQSEWDEEQTVIPKFKVEARKC